ncbi:hypothetical protein [Cypionkella psychrotolerans]|uniref:hypothetical protein n=1 Tax=Cypionkella psychrotolerans TaxID=1678131 RepID=UPI0006B5EDE9|nr:hypothetical protein [Cypionkella psychrotolerans]
MVSKRAISTYSLIELGKRSCTEHLAIDIIQVNWIERAEVALQKPAYTLKLFQDDITVSLGRVIVARALSTLEI